MHDSEACRTKSLLIGKAILNANNDYKVNISQWLVVTVKTWVCVGVQFTLSKNRLTYQFSAKHLSDA